MRENTLKLVSLAAMAVLLMSMSHCKKPTPAPNPPAQGYGTILFHMHTQFDTTEMAAVGSPYGPGDPYMTGSVETGGRNIRLKFAQMYISQVKLNTGNTASGPYYNIPGLCYVKSVDTEPYFISSHVPYGTYISPAYSIGLPADSNNLNPNTINPDTGYIGVKYLDMWTGNTSTGYWWIRFEGWVDTSASGKDSATCPFVFDIKASDISNGLPINIVLPPRGVAGFPSYPALSANNPVLTMHNIINYAYLFKGINLRGATPAQLSTIGNPTLAAKVAANATVIGPTGSAPTNYFIVYEE